MSQTITKLFSFYAGMSALPQTARFLILFRWYVGSATDSFNFSNFLNWFKKNRSRKWSKNRLKNGENLYLNFHKALLLVTIVSSNLQINQIWEDIYM